MERFVFEIRSRCVSILERGSITPYEYSIFHENQNVKSSGQNQKKSGKTPSPNDIPAQRSNVSSTARGIDRTEKFSPRSHRFYRAYSIRETRNRSRTKNTPQRKIVTDANAAAHDRREKLTEPCGRTLPLLLFGTRRSLLRDAKHVRRRHGAPPGSTPLTLDHWSHIDATILR